MANFNVDNAMKWVANYRRNPLGETGDYLDDTMWIESPDGRTFIITGDEDIGFEDVEELASMLNSKLTPAEPKEDIEFFKTSTPRPKMTNEDTRKRIANIIRENITFSGQIGDYIIHGAIEKLCDLIDENNRAWRDYHEQAEPKEEQSQFEIVKVKTGQIVECEGKKFTFGIVRKTGEIQAFSIDTI